MSVLTSAVAAVITDPGGRVLLCQQSQGHRLWGLPGGKIREGESPHHAVVRNIREETGIEIAIIDLVGIYQLTGGDHGLPDVLVHVFRGRITTGEALVNSRRICRLAWHDGAPEPITATTRVAIADARAGRSGVLRIVPRDAEIEPPDVTEAPALAGATTTAGPEASPGSTAVAA